MVTSLHLRNAALVLLRQGTPVAFQCHGVDGTARQSWERAIGRLRQAAPAGTENPSNPRREGGPADHAIPDPPGMRHRVVIQHKQHRVGVLWLGDKLAETPFDQDDLAFVDSVARQAAIAVDNAFLYENLAEQERLKHELDIARRIQLASLPEHTPRLPGLDIAGVSIPAQEVGGDYFDYLDGPGRDLTVIVGDVSGKGTSAALYMSKIQGIIQTLHQFQLSPRDLLIRANALIAESLEKNAFITVLGAYFCPEQRTARVARAGHLPLYHFRARSSKVIMVEPEGVGMGLAGKDEFARHLQQKTVRYAPGDVFVFLTDGIVEAQNAGGQEFGETPLMELIGRHHDDTAGGLCNRIIESVQRFSNNGAPHDDITAVVVRITEPA